LLSEKDYLRDKGLYENKVISDREFEAKKKDYLSILNNHESMKITAANARIQINDIEKNILQLQIQDYQEQVKLNYELKKSINFLLSEIDLWKQRYVIESPVVGKISFFDVWVANQNIKNGDALFYIIPTQTQKFIGKCVLPSANSGKIALGQKVNVKLDNYPYHENGMLQGRVASISEVPSKNAYAVDVILDQGLKTSYNKTLAYKEQMSGQADIITKNISVMDRIFFNLRKITERN
jgi:multidrug resistance efflux pump